MRAHQEYFGRKPDSAPRIAIVDLKDMPTQKEFELFKEFFEEQGHPSVICSPEELEFKDNRLRSGDFEIDIVYKRLLVNEYLPVMEESPALLDAYRAGAICMVNSFRSKLVHKKALFAVLTDERHARLFTEEEREASARTFPGRAACARKRASTTASRLTCSNSSRKTRDRLVLNRTTITAGTESISAGTRTRFRGTKDAERAGERRLSGAGARADGA